MSRALPILAATTGGMSAGAMLIIRLVLLPFWRGLPPREFRAWFAAHSSRIRALMVPLGSGAAGTALAAAAADVVATRKPHPASTIAAGATIGVVAVTLTVNEPANGKFVQIDFDDEETTRLLARWARWHDVRVALGLLGAFAAARALADR